MEFSIIYFYGFPNAPCEKYFQTVELLGNVQDVLLKDIRQPISQDFPVHLVLHLRIGIFYLLQLGKWVGETEYL